MSKKLVFLSVPKTGTTAYQTALGPYADIVVSNPPDLKHAPVYRYNRFFRPMFEKVCEVQMETLAVMREPIDWLGSWYRYRQRPFMKGHPNSTRDISFDDFVLGYMKGNKPGFANVGNQVKFLEPQPNGVGINHLFRYDDKEGLHAFLTDRLGVTFELQKENVSPPGQVTLSPDVERRFKRKCAEQFELYDSIPRRGG
ncbi:gamma-glutamyl kinase [Thalassococcus sp. S3]|uniref:gamma-glutamyl kinase n=1 Tax=Thalassococcus sp. S3 TaxID=2017482 RepID=UPI00352FE853